MSDNLHLEIESLEAEVDQYEDVDPKFMPLVVRGLWHRIFYVHSSTESILETLILREIHGHLVGRYVTPEIHERLMNTQSILSELSFYKKLKLCEKFKAFDNYSNLPSLIENLNSLRNDFAHPEIFALNKYREPETRLKVLNLLVNIMRGLNSMFSVARVGTVTTIKK